MVGHLCSRDVVPCCMSIPVKLPVKNLVHWSRTSRNQDFVYISLIVKYFEVGSRKTLQNRVRFGGNGPAIRSVWVLLGLLLWSRDAVICHVKVVPKTCRCKSRRPSGIRVGWPLSIFKRCRCVEGCLKRHKHRDIVQAIEAWESVWLYYIGKKNHSTPRFTLRRVSFTGWLVYCISAFPRYICLGSENVFTQLCIELAR